MNRVSTLEHPPPRLLLGLSAVTRLALAVAAGITVASVLDVWVGEAHTRLLAGWDAAVSVYLALAWAVIHSLDASATRLRVRRHDQSSYVVFLIVVAAACASLVAITWGLREIHDLSGGARTLHVALVVVALSGSWLMIHTVFAFHYARAYYRPQGAGDEHVRGLRFPGGHGARLPGVPLLTWRAR